MGFKAKHLVGAGWKQDVDALWQWGTCILGGFVLRSIVDCMYVAVASSLVPREDVNEKGRDDETRKPSPSSRIRILAGVLIGDLFNKLCDGIFVGAAFNGGGNSFGWSVALSLHQTPISIVLGAIIVLASDPDDSNVGMLLAFGAGVYLHIGAMECTPKIYKAKLSTWLRGACVVANIVGTVLIALILLDHARCVPAAPIT